MKRATFYIASNVQTAGYRARVITIAKAFGIKGTLANLRDGRVKVIAEGEKADLEKFAKAINIKNALINVTQIEKKYSLPTLEYDDFYKLVSEGETDERLDTAANLLKELINVTRKGFEDIGKRQDIMIERQDKTMAKIDQSREEIVGEIRLLRDDFKSLFDERISKIENEISEIKSKISAL